MLHKIYMDVKLEFDQGYIILYHYQDDKYFENVKFICILLSSLGFNWGVKISNGKLISGDVPQWYRYFARVDTKIVEKWHWELHNISTFINTNLKPKRLILKGKSYDI